MARVLTIAQQKGGAGKTTLAANIAVALMGRGLRVGVVDSDPQGSLGRWYLEREEAGRAVPEFSTASAWGVSIEVRRAKGRVDWLIIDTPPKIDADLRPALRVSERVLVPVSASHVDVWATDGVLDLCGREDREALVVLNRVRPGTRLAGEVAEAAQALGAEVSPVSLGNRVAFADALGRGLGVTEMPGAKPAAAEIEALVDLLG